MDKQKSFNIGWAFLRIWMSFEVVLVHCWSATDVESGDVLWLFMEMGMNAVPVFMLMAFILSGPVIYGNDNKKLVERMKRLIVPYIAWAVIHFVIYELLRVITGEELTGGIGALCWQLVLGSSRNLNPQMWYQFILIILTLVFVVIFRLFKDKAIAIGYGVMLLGLILQYSGINGNFFIKYPEEVFNSLGRICEILPYAYVGILISKKEILKKLNKRFAIGICVSLLAFLLSFEFFLIPIGFGYQGVRGLSIAVLVLVLFYFLPFDKLPDIVIRLIVFCSEYTFGVFCIHMMIGRLLNIYVFSKYGWKLNSFRECVLIYCISFACSVLIGKLPLKLCKRLVM